MALDIELLDRHIDAWKAKLTSNPQEAIQARAERVSRVLYYQEYTSEKIRAMNEEDFYGYISQLWAMLIWGNKKYVVDKLIEDNGFEKIKAELASLVWGNAPVKARWDHFRSVIKGMGPAMMSEILCDSLPDQCMLWNRRAYVGLRYLGIENLPRYNYQVTGSRYADLCRTAQTIAERMKARGIPDVDLLTLDFFIWDELQVEENLSQIHKKGSPLEVDEPEELAIKSDSAKEFLHNEVRDKLADIGKWLGFSANIEIKVADGAKVDAVWEATIGNLGRVIYVFEVQTKGSIDSLVLNLMKARNNPAVQGVVAVSDKVQIDKIKKEVANLPDLKDKLKYWDYENVLKVHEALEAVNESINRLGLVPQSILSA
jgi:hypothetical protein